MTESSTFAKTIMKQKYSHEMKTGELEEWPNIAFRVTKHVGKALGLPTAIQKEMERIITLKKFIPAGRYLAASGRSFHQTQNCLALEAEDSREGWADLIWKSTMALMTGAGIGIEYSKIRASGKKIRRTGGVCTGPIALMEIINESARGIRQGGDRRAAIWSGLNWSHPDIHKYINIKNWSSDVVAMKEKDFNFPATLDGTNISVGLDDEFFKAFENDKHAKHSLAHSVYWAVIKQMCQTGEPGFSVNIGKNKNNTLRNACTEFITDADSDICNLGSINLANIESLEEMEYVTDLATLFLIAGSVYSDVPYPKVDSVRTKNRKIGLGLMGIHEWLLMRGKKYGADEELTKYLEIYAKNGESALKYCEKYELSVCTSFRAIAPAGSIAIIGETTSGGEPLFCAGYKRRYKKGDSTAYQYVLDPTAVKLVKKGINPDTIEDAYTLAEDVERRIAFQAYLQQYVDMGISSTINLPSWGSEFNNEGTIQKFGDTLYKYLPKLRGITAYPDAARGGQPLVPMRWKDVEEHVGQIFYESVDVCDLTKGGSCSA